MTMFDKHFYLVLGFIFFAATNSFATKNTVPAVPDLEVRIIIDAVYPVGSVFIAGDADLIPPGQGIEDIQWVEDIGAQGSLIMGYSSTGDWAVALGTSAGGSQTTDPHQLTMDEMANHAHAQAEAFQRSYNFGLSTVSVPSVEVFRNGKNSGPRYLPFTGVVGNDQPHTHTLKELKRYGIKIWKRVA